MRALKTPHPSTRNVTDRDAFIKDKTAANAATVFPRSLFISFLPVESLDLLTLLFETLGLGQSHTLYQALRLLYRCNCFMILRLVS